ncbi:MAG: hypothetical protein M0Z28_13815 [Rhodospirillales bacterium]|nr:hypothetical protein [Rhodospirillales bacterium]
MTASVDAMALRDVRLSNGAFAAQIPQQVAPSICVAVSIHPTIVARRARSQSVVLLASISVDLRFGKDDRREAKVPIRKDGKIKACGTTARDRSRFQCLHIGLSTAATVPRLRNEARQPRVRSASIGAFSQCHQGSLASGRFAVSFGAWLAPTMTRAFVHASAARAAGTIDRCWPRRRSSARSRGQVRWPGRPASHRLPAHGVLPPYRQSVAGARPSFASERPRRGAGRRRGPERAASWYTPAMS